MSLAPRRRAALLCAALLALAACAGPSPSPTPLASTDPTLPASASVLPSVDPSVQPSSSASVDGVTYVVVGGDTLFSIARTWSTTVAQLQAWNADRYPSLVTNPDGLRGGMDPCRLR